eukprot:6523864-Lingulodinium_polyedra.AAC.1
MHLHGPHVHMRLGPHLERDAPSGPFGRGILAPRGEGLAVRRVRGTQHATRHEPHAAQLRGQPVDDMEELDKGPELRALHKAAALHQLREGVPVEVPADVPGHRRRAAQGRDVGVVDDDGSRVGAHQPGPQQPLQTVAALPGLEDQLLQQHSLVEGGRIAGVLVAEPAPPDHVPWAAGAVAAKRR